MAMTTMRRSNIIVVVQVKTHAGGTSFFAGVKMDESGYCAGGKLGVDSFLKLADRLHYTVGVRQLFFRQLHQRFLSATSRFTTRDAW